MKENSKYLLEYKSDLLNDAFLGSKEALQKKLDFLSNLAQAETWDCKGRSDKWILRNYLCYTYDKVKAENKIAILDDNSAMCFNTGLLNIYGVDIYAYFVKNKHEDKQKWYLSGFKTNTDRELRVFKQYPDIADYFTSPADFIYDKSLGEPHIDYEHIIEDNYDRFLDIGLEDNEFTIIALLQSAVKKIVEKVKRNYKLAIPQYYTDKSTNEGKIQLLLPLFLRNNDVADLALVVDKGESNYVGKTILTIEWAYVNSRRIVRPDVEWLKI